MHSLVKSVIVAAFAVVGTAVAAQAAIVACPLNQATRTITNLPQGWVATAQTSAVTDWKVDNSGGQQKLVCVYGAAGQVVRLAPQGQACTKVPNRRFNCQALPPPPPPAAGVIAQGSIQLADNSSAEIDGGGQQDMRLDASNPFLRLLVPLNGTQFSAQGTAKPTVNACLNAPYSSNAIPQNQLPVGVWLCIKTSDDNVARLFIANIAGIPGLPLPMTIFADYTTWSPGGQNPNPNPQPQPDPNGPTVVSSKTIALKQTFAFNLDNGAIGGGPNSDVWFQAVNAFQMFLVPQNGTQFAAGDLSQRGYDGCASESFTPNKIPLQMVPPGSYICAVTSEGRVSEFRLTAITPGSPKTATIKYTTWE